jgi:periplasmic protein TonB
MPYQIVENLKQGGNMSSLIPSVSWEDVVFENRNKDYGAYRLRYSYPYYLTFSTLFVIALFLSIMVGHQLLREKQPQATGAVTGDIIRIVDPIQPPPIEKNEVPKPAVTRYEVPKITSEDVKADQQMPTQDQAIALADNSIVDRPVPVEGQKEVELVEAPPPVIEVAKVIEPVPDVIKNPEFPGGMKEGAKWLSNHLEYPAMAVRMGIEGKVVVEFTVDENGKISDATVIESLHKLCDQEAIRLVKSMPAWTPGEKNGIKTARKYTLPIRFVLQ